MSLLDQAREISISSDLEAFDFICRHLRSQGEKCLGVWGDCAYRGVEPHECDEHCEDNFDDHYSDNSEQNGKACAVGVLIKEGFYSWTLEGNPIEDLSVTKAVRDSHPNWNIGLKSLGFLRLVQTVHDRNEPRLWPLYFLKLTENFVKVDGSYVLSDTFINNIYYENFGLSAWREKLPDSLGTTWADWNYLFSILDQMKG